MQGTYAKRVWVLVDRTRVKRSENRAASRTVTKLANAYKARRDRIHSRIEQALAAFARSKAARWIDARIHQIPVRRFAKWTRAATRWSGLGKLVEMTEGAVSRTSIGKLKWAEKGFMATAWTMGGCACATAVVTKGMVTFPGIELGLVQGLVGVTLIASATVAADFAKSTCSQERAWREGDFKSLRHRRLRQRGTAATKELIEGEVRTIRNVLQTLGRTTGHEHCVIHNWETGETYWTTDGMESEVSVPARFSARMETGRRCWELWHNHPGSWDSGEAAEASMSVSDLYQAGREGVIATGVVNDDGDWTRIELDDEWVKERSSMVIRQEVVDWAECAVWAGEEVWERISEAGKGYPELYAMSEEAWAREGKELVETRWRMNMRSRQRSMEISGMARVTTSFETKYTREQEEFGNAVDSMFREEMRRRGHDGSEQRKKEPGRRMDIGRGMGEPATGNDGGERSGDRTREAAGTYPQHRHLGGDGKAVAAQDERAPRGEAEASRGQRREGGGAELPREMRTRPELPSRKRQGPRERTAQPELPRELPELRSRTSAASTKNPEREPANATKDTARRLRPLLPSAHRPTSAEPASHPKRETTAEKAARADAAHRAKLANRPAGEARSESRTSGTRTK